MKKILYLSFYFEPDLCAGSFRNTPLAKELATKTLGIADVDVFTTIPNRYKTYLQVADSFENDKNLYIHRIKIPTHNSGLIDQIRSFAKFYFETRKKTKKVKYDLVFASSSRLFTAYLGYSIARRSGIPLYIDVRDIFYDSMKDLFEKNPVKWIYLPILKYIEHRTFSYASHLNLISHGFSEYFNIYKNANITSFTNGIDDDFLNAVSNSNPGREPKLILYAGNIGEGQGLHKFVPELAKYFENKYEFKIIGDGGAKDKLVNRLKELDCSNVQINNPVSRALLLKEYADADFYLIHLNDYDALKKVLPSKIFELGSIDKPIIAGVGGYSAEFIRKYVENVILVKPCDVDDCVRKLKGYKYKRIKRLDFINHFKRSRINQEMASSIASYLVKSN